MMENKSDTLPLLTTKLYRPPVTPELEQRTRLIERLENRRQRPLTLISAPAGYGKTMLVSMWLESCGCSYGWVSLDEYDNDLHTFVSYLLAAVDNAFPTLHLKTTSILTAPTNLTVPVLARYLLNDLDQIQEPFILVLDDTHRIKEPEIYELLGELLRHPLQSMNLVLIGRHDPRLNIASLRAHGQVTEIRAQDLRFTARETAGLLSHLLDRQIDDTVAADWARMTEGWVTALRLAAMSLRHRGRADDLRVSIQGDSRYLREYLLGEVLARLPKANQDWLLKTALLDRFCAPLIEAVCWTESDQALLSGGAFISWLEAQNLFLVALDDRGEWFRFHHLFQQLLQSMLRAQLRTEEVAALQTRVSLWFAEKGLINEALQYALVAGDVQAAIHLIEQHRYDLMNNQQWHRLNRWLELLPSDVVARSPILVSTKAYIAVYRGEDLALVSALQRAEQLIADLTPGTVERETVESEISVISAVFDVVFGHPTRIIKSVQSRLKSLPQQALFIRSLAIGVMTLGLQMQGDMKQGATLIRDALAEDSWPDAVQAYLMHLLCIAFIHEGDLTNLLASARSGLWITEKLHAPEIQSYCRYDLGIAHYLRNEFERAEPVLQALLKDREISAPTYVANGGFALVRMYQAQGRVADAAQVFNMLENHFQETRDLAAQAYTAAFRVDLMIHQQKLTEARRLSKTIDFDIRPPMWFFYLPQLTAIKLLLAEGKPRSLEDAHTQLDVLAETARAINRNNVRIDVLALLALVCAAQGKEPTALEKLRAALDLGMIGGNLRSFVDLGAPMADLLLRLRGQEAEREYEEYIDQILAAFPDEVRAKQTSEFAATRMDHQPPKTTLIEPLTTRELQVLKLLATDLSRQEIADKLYISPGTLHVHTKNIYRKLDVHKRTEAVQIAKEFGIL